MVRVGNISTRDGIYQSSRHPHSHAHARPESAMGHRILHWDAGAWRWLGVAGSRGIGHRLDSIPIRFFGHPIGYLELVGEDRLHRGNRASGGGILYLTLDE